MMAAGTPPPPPPAPCEVVWFKRDLRIHDHEPLWRALDAVRRGQAARVVCVYILEPELWQQPDLSRRHYLFLKDCVDELSRDLWRWLGIPLIIKTGAAVDVLDAVCAAASAAHLKVHRLWSHQETWNNWTYQRDRAVRRYCRARGVKWEEPRQIAVVRRLKKRDGWAAQWTRLMQAPQFDIKHHLLGEPVAGEAAVGATGVAGFFDPECCAAPVPHRLPPPEVLGIRPCGCKERQGGGRAAACWILGSFLSTRGALYSMNVSSPLTAWDGCSRLSTHLAFGTISMREVFQNLERLQRKLRGEKDGGSGGKGKAAAQQTTTTAASTSVFMSGRSCETERSIMNAGARAAAPAPAPLNSVGGATPATLASPPPPPAPGMRQPTTQPQPRPPLLHPPRACDGGSWPQGVVPHGIPAPFGFVPASHAVVFPMTQSDGGAQYAPPSGYESHIVHPSQPPPGGTAPNPPVSTSLSPFTAAETKGGGRRGNGAPNLKDLQSFASRLRWHCHFIQKLEDEPRVEFENMHTGYNGLRNDGATSVEELTECERIRYRAWVEGRTGYPMVDACMRAVNATGWLNFRMRAMLVSFASYHLWLHWRLPAIHLARMFTDYEPGIHYSQFQMQSGTTGINTVRCYNPIKQSVDQDPSGEFILYWVPELRSRFGPGGELLCTWTGGSDPVAAALKAEGRPNAAVVKPAAKRSRNAAGKKPAAKKSAAAMRKAAKMQWNAPVVGKTVHAPWAATKGGLSRTSRTQAQTQTEVTQTQTQIPSHPDAPPASLLTASSGASANDVGVDTADPTSTLTPQEREAAEYEKAIIEQALAFGARVLSGDGDGDGDPYTAFPVVDEATARKYAMARVHGLRRKSHVKVQSHKVAFKHGSRKNPERSREFWAQVARVAEQQGLGGGMSAPSLAEAVASAGIEVASLPTASEEGPPRRKPAAKKADAAPGTQPSKSAAAKGKARGAKGKAAAAATTSITQWITTTAPAAPLIASDDEAGFWTQVDGGRLDANDGLGGNEGRARGTSRSNGNPDPQHGDGPQRKRVKRAWAAGPGAAAGGRTAVRMPTSDAAASDSDDGIFASCTVAPAAGAAADASRSPRRPRTRSGEEGDGLPVCTLPAGSCPIRMEVDDVDVDVDSGSCGSLFSFEDGTSAACAIRIDPLEDSYLAKPGAVGDGGSCVVSHDPPTPRGAVKVERPRAHDVIELSDSEAGEGENTSGSRNGDDPDAESVIILSDSDIYER